VTPAALRALATARIKAVELDAKSNTMATVMILHAQMLHAAADSSWIIIHGADWPSPAYHDPASLLWKPEDRASDALWREPQPR
jgi:hypothetical protein